MGHRELSQLVKITALINVTMCNSLPIFKRIEPNKSLATYLKIAKSVKLRDFIGNEEKLSEYIYKFINLLREFEFAIGKSDKKRRLNSLIRKANQTAEYFK